MKWLTVCNKSGEAGVYADKSGIYLQEVHKHNHFRFWNTYEQQSGMLVKLDNNMIEQYRNDFDKALEGKDYFRLFFVQDRLYLFASDFIKKDKTGRLYAVEIDKGSGQPKGGWKEICVWAQEHKDDMADVNISPNEDSSKMVVVSAAAGKDQGRYEIRLMDADLRPVGSPLHISNEFDPKTFQVQDFVYTTSGNVVLMGRVFEYVQGKRKGDRSLVFQRYSIRIYDAKGAVVQDIVTDNDNRYLVTGKMKQVNRELVLAAFFSNEKNRREINGLLVQRIDPLTGKVLMTSRQDLTKGQISEFVDGDDDNKKKITDPDGGLDANVVFRNFYLTPDNGLVILAEKYSTWFWERTAFTGSGVNRVSYVVTYRCFGFGDIYMAKISMQGNIDWMNILPKRQYEMSSVVSVYHGDFEKAGYFDLDAGPAFFAGFSSMAGSNTIHLFFNDEAKNADILQPGKKILQLNNYEKSTCFQINVDMTTGKYNRTILFSNKDIPTAMIRKGVVMGNTMWVAGMQTSRVLKWHIDVGKIVSAD